ncbi:MAG: hypothetical protein M1829_000683 [Trizodia sp. TS-e1964]|nr:MAG: hypothetical protein M1829_000683 [Trizodia sp. TS-e1964]
MDESLTLKSVKPDSDVNGWPEFELLNVQIYNTSGSLSSLLIAGKNQELTIRGNLKLQPKQQKYLVRRNFSATTEAPLKICGVNHFAYGLDESDEAKIWAAGKAGWYIINPHKNYEEIYAKMQVSIRLLYLLGDKYSTQKVRKGSRKFKGSAHDVFKEYSDRQKLGNIFMARDVFHEHRIFLMSQMLEGKLDIQWHKTPMYQYMRQTFQSEFQDIKSQSVLNHDQADSSDEETGTQGSTSVSVDPENPAIENINMLMKKSLHFKENSKTARDLILFQMMVEIQEANALSPAQLDIQTVANAIYERINIDNPQIALGAIEVEGSKLLLLMETTHSQNFDWKSSQIYLDLKNAVYRDQNFPPTPQFPRSKSPKARKQNADSELSDSSPDLDQNIGPLSGSKRRSRQSMLRLKRTATKGPARSSHASGKILAAGDFPKSDAEDESDGYNSRSKRRALESESLRHRNKKRNTSHQPSRIRTQSPGLTSQAHVAPEGAPQSLSRSASELKLDPQHKLEDPGLTFRMVSTPIPSSLSNTPGDIWTCTMRNCSHKVYVASTPDGKRLIREHFQEHNRRAQEQLDLIYKEERPSISSSHLVDLIRKYLPDDKEHKAEEAESIGESSVKLPKPIVRAAWH